MNYQELENMLERLDEIRLAILDQSPTRSEEKALNAAYCGIERAQNNLRALCRADQSVSTLEGGAA